MHRLFESSRGESSFVSEQGEHLVHCVALRYITCYNPLVMIVYLRARASQRSLSGNRNWKVLIEKKSHRGMGIGFAATRVAYGQNGISWRWGESSELSSGLHWVVNDV